MIIRILTEGQWSVDAEALADLNALDEAVESALVNGNQDALDLALGALLDEVRAKGVEVPDDVIAESDLILPALPATLAEVRGFLEESDLSQGLIPDVVSE